LFEIESEDLRDTGDWKQFTLYAQGQLKLLDKYQHAFGTVCRLLTFNFDSNESHLLY